jgi:pyrimidine deaminase RibD-like protein
MCMMIDKGFFRLAKNVSRSSKMWPQIGAVIVKKKPVAVGWNVQKTTPYTGYFSQHAEFNALIHCETDTKGADIYVYREDMNGNPKLARPCRICIGYLREAGFKNMYYTIDVPPYWQKEKIEKKLYLQGKGIIWAS